MIEAATPTWSNKDNHALYNVLPLEQFKAIAKRSGLSNGEDVSQVEHIIVKSQNILELGAGYGRVLDKIGKMNFKGRLSAIENNQFYYDLCTKKYSSKVRMHFDNILTWEPTEKYDLILWMWTSIGEFTQYEQKKLFSKLSKLLTRNGVLVIEKKDAGLDDQDRLIVNGGNCKYLYHKDGGDIYIPSDYDLKLYSNSVFKTSEMIKYTTNNLIRKIFIYSDPL